MTEHTDSVMTEEARVLSSPTTDAPQRASDAAVTYFAERSIVYISLPICIFGLIGNGLLACVLCNKVKRTKFTVYIFNIAAADFIVLIYHVIMFVLFLEATPITQRFLLKMEMVHEIGFGVSLYLLTAISTERFLSLFFTDFYTRARPLNFTVFVCIVLWGLSTVMSLVIHLSCNVKPDSTHHEPILSCESATIFQLIVNFVVFSPLLAFTTVGLFVRMRSLPEETPVLRLDITIVATVVVFLVLAASVKMVEILAHWIPKWHVQKVFVFFQLLDSIQSSGKPFLYIFIGYSRNLQGPDRFHMYLERALMDERHIVGVIES